MLSRQKVGAEIFISLGALIARAGSLLDRWEVGDVVAGDDAVFLDALVDRHPHASLVVGPGIHHFTKVRGDGRYETRCVAHRVDGTVVRFDPPDCARHIDYVDEVDAAMWRAVGDQLLEYKGLAFGEGSHVRDEAGRKVSWEAADVVHASGFREEVARFIRGAPLTKKLLAEWRRHHARAAQLVVVNRRRYCRVRGFDPG